MKTSRPILVLAENRIAAASWAEEQGLRPSQWWYIHSRAQLLGCAHSEYRVHRTGLYFQHPDNAHLEEEIRLRGFSDYIEGEKE